MRRTKLNFDKFSCANLLKLAAVAILLTACFPTHSMAQQPGQKTFSSAGRREQRTRHGSRRVTTKKRCSISSDQTGSKSSRRETRPRTPTAALISYRNIRKCTVW